MSLIVPELNRDSFDHLNRSVYDFWTTFALSAAAALVVSDFLSAILDAFGPTVKTVGTLIVALIIFAPGPAIIGDSILEGKDQNMIKVFIDFPLQPGGLLIDFVDQGAIDLITDQKEVPLDPTTGKPTGEAKIPKDPALRDAVIEAKAAGSYSWAHHVEIPQRKWPWSKEAYQPIEDIVFHATVPRSAAMVPEPGAGVYKGVSMKKLAHQCVVGGFYVRSIHYTISSKPVPIIRLSLNRGEHLRQLKGGKMLPTTDLQVQEIENAYKNIGSVELKMERDRFAKENEELKQQRQYDTWDYYAKAKEALDKERQAFGGQPLRSSTFRWLTTTRGLIGLTMLGGLLAVFLYFLAAYLSAPKPHP